jgi:hypothetical protein
VLIVRIGSWAPAVAHPPLSVKSAMSEHSAESGDEPMTQLSAKGGLLKQPAPV